MLPPLMTLIPDPEIKVSTATLTDRITAAKIVFLLSILSIELLGIIR
jgi:hypothetical protein